MPTRARRKRRVKNPEIQQLPFQETRNPFKPMEIVSADEIEHIHNQSLRILAEIGIKVDSQRALNLLRQAGAKIDQSKNIVKLDRELVEEMLIGIPSEFIVHARDPKKTLKIGNNSLLFETVCGPSFVSDIDRGRRAGTLQDMQNFVKLTQSLNIFHHEGGSGCEPLDLPAETRYLDMMLAQLTLSDKGWQPCWMNSAERARDCIEMAKIALQLNDDGLLNNPGVLGGVNTNSPLLFDEGQAEAVIEFARAGQPVHITPFTLAGAMSPATIGGSLVQQNAEALAGIILGQAAQRYSPVFYGHFTSNVDMKSGSPAFGTPEYAKSVIVSAQLARRYNLPIRSSNTTAANCVDAQATYESFMSINACIQGHVNVMMHAGGWLEGGLTCSFEKLILDAEILQMQSSFLAPIDLSDSAIGLEAIQEVGSGGHFFGTQHTLDRYQNAFYQPILSDWRNFETWSDDGAKSATQRANTIWKQLLNDYEKPHIDPAIEEELETYVAKRKEQISLN